jgi:hypothetical protein
MRGHVQEVRLVDHRHLLRVPPEGLGAQVVEAAEVVRQ